MPRLRVTPDFPPAWRLVATGLGLLALSGCGGGGGAQASTPPPGAPPADGGATDWAAGVFAPSSSFAAQCAAPRTGTDPDTGLPYPDVQGSRGDENHWLRSWSNELYLWYGEITDRDPASFETDVYFSLLKTFATTASGQPKDRFHFSLPTDEWEQLARSGAAAGYGARFAVVSEAPPREIVVAFTEPDSPATRAPAKLARGARILEIDGVDAVNGATAAELAVLSAGLSPLDGESHTFTVRDAGTSATRTFTMTATVVTADPVPVVTSFDTPTGRIGYLAFNSHIATAEQALIDAIGTLAAADIDDLVLDLRYNGGGFLFIASEVAYMIAGSTATAGRAFESTRFNDKHPDTNPITGAPLTPVPFFDTAGGYSAPAGQPLPSLDLARLFVLTGPDTCSASEAIINALIGVDLEVIQIGSTTCGKPYGFYPTDNCGTTYFSIQFEGVNDKNVGGYADGFSPANATGLASTFLPGCAVADDFDHALGDPAEARLAAALDRRDFGTCPSPSALGAGVQTKPSLGGRTGDARLIRMPWESIRLLDGP